MLRDAAVAPGVSSKWSPSSHVRCHFSQALESCLSRSKEPYFWGSLRMWSVLCPARILCPLPAGVLSAGYPGLLWCYRQAKGRGPSQTLRATMQIGEGTW